MKKHWKEYGFVIIVGAAMLIISGLLYWKDDIDEHRRQDIFLNQTAPEVPYEESPAEQKEESPAWQAEENRSNAAAFPKVALRVEGEERGLTASMWQSGSGVCYFFLPGYSEGESLVLADAEGGSIEIGGSRIEEHDVIHNIVEGEEYKMTVYDRNRAVLLEAPAVFLYSSRLPVIALTIEPENMEQIDADKETGMPGSVTVYDEAGNKLYDGYAEEISGRGNSTWGLLKKPYQFKLVDNADLFGFGETKRYNLLANGYDETKLRNRIAEELANELGMAYVPESQMVDLYINGVYHGNYYLTEKIRVDEEGVAITDMEQVLSDAYEKQEREQFPKKQNEDGSRRWVEIPEQQEDISGGYLLERELSSRYLNELSGFMTTYGDCYVLQSPKYASKQQVDYIADLMQQFQDAVAEEDGCNPVNGRHYSEYIDITSFAQKYLVEEISRNYDGGVTSSFFYKPDDSVSEKIYAGPIWDYDVAFGNCNLDRISSNPVGITKLAQHVYGTDLFEKLYGQEDFYQEMTKLYRQRALPYLNELLESGIDEMVEETRDSVRMDCIRWEMLENRYQYYQEYENDIRYLKYFIEARRDFLNEVWLSGEVYHNVTFVVDGAIWEIDCVKDGEVPKREPIPYRYSLPSLFMGWYTENNIPYDGYKPVYEDITYYAVWQELTEGE